MKLHFTLTFILCCCFLVTRGQTSNPEGQVHVIIHTTMGEVRVRLYDDTPLHRDNFIRLCRAGAYDGLLFHRVVKDFIVQGGDPESKKREPGVHYGSGDGGYTIPAEILPHHFCKRGALIDARLHDGINPECASAGTQFCLVQGRVLNDEDLEHQEKGINEMRKNRLYHYFAKRLRMADPELPADSLPVALRRHIWEQVRDTLQVLGDYKIPEAHRQHYKTYGGYPYIDGSMTVFGEMVDGFDVLDAMSQVQTDEGARPIEDLVILSTTVVTE